MHIKINRKYLTYNKYKVKCALGKKGIGNKKREGDLITPKGQYKVKFILCRRDRIKNIKSRIKIITIQKNMGWCDDPKSEKYNQLVKLPFNFSHEKLFKNENIYDLILVLNYNMNPIRKNKGSAIFIHVAKNNYSKTRGCIAINKISLINVIKNLKKNTVIKISNRK